DRVRIDPLAAAQAHEEVGQLRGARQAPPVGGEDAALARLHGECAMTERVLGRQRDLASMHAALTAWLRARRPGEDLTLSALVSPKAGISNETFLVDVTSLAGVERMVVRVEPTDFLVFPAYDLARQVRVMRSLAGSTVPVPHVLWLEEDPRHLGSAFYGMARIEGE